MQDEKKYKWHKVASPDEFLVAEGIILNLRLAEKHICVTQVQGEYYAFQSKCPHAGAAFEHGWINEDNCLVCPLHRFQFDVRTGRNVSGEGFHLVRYPVKTDERGVWIGVLDIGW
ncbi:MAG: hypothetical protein RL660_1085 [Bacteroidota bacterium]|jgi:nitrite reductase/ring-hydroxylating ferredoxin subunit